MENNDYKYSMGNLSSLSIGAKFSYKELEDDEDVSYKYRCIIKRFIEKEVDPETTIESHFYYMDPDSESCRIYKLLKTKVRIYYPSVRKKLFGKSETIYEEAILKAEEIAAMSPAEKERKGIMIHEIQISKVGLMSYAM